MSLRTQGVTYRPHERRTSNIERRRAAVTVHTTTVPHSRALLHPSTPIHRLRCQNGEFMMQLRLREAPWYDDEIRQREERPDCVEDEEVEGAGAEDVPVIAPPVDNCSHRR